jgi:hypothetical protein
VPPLADADTGFDDPGSRCVDGRLRCFRGHDRGPGDGEAGPLARKGDSLFSRVLAAIVTADAFDRHMREQSIFERT